MKKLSKRRKLEVVIGLIIAIISASWIWHFISLYYAYNYTDILFAFMYTTWMLTILTFLSCLGLMIGFQVVVGKRKFKSGTLIGLALLMLGYIADVLYHL